MDTITHGIVGALTGKAFFAGPDRRTQLPNLSGPHAKSSATARTAIVACTIGSIFPDIDIFAGSVAHNPLAIMEWHRNITHSIVLLPVWALLLALASLPLTRWMKWQSPPFPRLFAIYAVGLATHVFLDLITSFGTMAWSPLKYSRPAWDWLFIVDLTLSALALVPQLVAWCYREPRKLAGRAVFVWAVLTVGAFGGYALASTTGYGFPIGVVGIVSGIIIAVLLLPAIRGAGFGWSRANWCRVGLALVCAYLACACVMHRRALADVSDFAAVHGFAGSDHAAVPLPPTLTHWAGLVRAPKGVWRTTFHEPSGIVERAQFYPDAQSDVYAQKAKKLHDVQVYLWFAKFPVWQVNHSADGTVLDISDVRFFREDDPPANPESPQPSRFGRMRANRSGFTFEIIFDSTGNIVFHGLKKPQP